MSRSAVRVQVLTCTNCGLVKGCHAPVPMSAEGQVDFAVVGEAPGPDEDEKGTPFIGRSGTYLRNRLTKVGLDPARVAYLNVVSCWPNEDGKTRAPTDDEMRACRHNLIDQLEAAKARYALLLGATATAAWRSDVQLKKVHGYLFRWGPYYVMPTYHPAGVLRQKARSLVLLQDLRAWASLLATGPNPDMRMPTCWQCDLAPVGYDPEWIAYCGVHAPLSIN